MLIQIVPAQVVYASTGYFYGSKYQIQVRREAAFLSCLLLYTLANLPGARA